MSQDEFEQVEQEAQTLMEAAAIFENLIEAERDMIEEGQLPEDDAAADMEADMETAKEACEAVSMAMTIGLMQHGYVPDYDDEDDRDSGDRSAFM